MSVVRPTRFEVIDHRKPFGESGVETGRVYMANPCEVELSYQDNGRTLKVFITGERHASATPVDAVDPVDG